MLRAIIGITWRRDWRRAHAPVLLTGAALLSAMAILAPYRGIRGPQDLQSSLLGIQILTGLLYTLGVAVPSTQSRSFLLDQRRIGPLAVSGLRIMGAHHLGQALSLGMIWCPLILLQTVGLFLADSLTAASWLYQGALGILACQCVLSWGRTLGALLPTGAALPGTVALVVLSQFLLTRPDSFPVVFQPALGLVYEAAGGTPSPGTVAAALTLTLCTAAISNLLSTWALEIVRGALCLLDRRQGRS